MDTERAERWSRVGRGAAVAGAWSRGAESMAASMQVLSAVWDTCSTLPALCVYPVSTVFLLTPIPERAGLLALINWDLDTGSVGHQDVFSH